MAVKRDGTVWAWGANSEGQLGNGNANPSSSNPVQVLQLGAVTAIAAGLNHALALRSDGTVWGWGGNHDGQLGVNPGWSPLLAAVDLGPQVYSVAAGAGAGGSITPATPQQVVYNRTATFTVTPGTGYRILSVTGCGGSLTGNSYVTAPITGNCAVTATFQQDSCGAGCRSLTLTLTGTGRGTVNSAGEGFTCSTGSCVGTFPPGTQLTLMATASADSVFSGWSGACTNASGNCTVALTADRTVSATFSAAPNAMIGGTGYPSLAAAYAAAPTGSSILLRDTELTENLILGRAVSVRLRGGYNASFSSRTGLPTRIKGTLRIRGGKVAADRLALIP